MKKFGLYVFVALMGIFLVCGCNDKKVSSAKKKESEYMSILNDYEKALKTAVQKVRDAESKEELRSIDNWLEAKEDIFDDKADAFKEKHRDEWTDIHEQIETAQGEYGEKFAEIKMLRSKYKGLYKKRLNEF